MMDSRQKISRTVQSALREAAAALSARGIGQPRLEAEILLGHVLEAGKEELILHPDRVLNGGQEERFRQYVHRRCRKEPVAYITGRREFWSLDFRVNPSVLIPRPETEGVIECLVRIAGTGNRERDLQILDVGTGSGIIAVTAAVEFPTARVTAVDVSVRALEVARENAQRHHVSDRIEFLQMDMMKPWQLPDNGGYDFILSNPPYISSEEMDRLMPDVRDYEPRSALDGGPEGITCYRRIVPEAVQHLKPGGHLIVEIGEGQALLLKHLISAHGELGEIALVKDLSGRDRVMSARRTLG